MNLGDIDRMLRVTVGITLVGLTYTNVVGLWGWIGAVPLLTGLIGWCPAYKLIGLKTCPVKRSGQ